MLYFKPADKEAEANEKIAKNAFVLILQSEWQRKVWNEIGAHYLGTDGTHNVTQYESLILYSLLGRDEWGKGTFLSSQCFSSDSLSRRTCCIYAGLEQ